MCMSFFTVSVCGKIYKLCVILIAINHIDCKKNRLRVGSNHQPFG